MLKHNISRGHCIIKPHNAVVDSIAIHLMDAVACTDIAILLLVSLINSHRPVYRLYHSCIDTLDIDYGRPIGP